MDKSAKKRIEGECYFCKNKDYNLLDCHRIIPGSESGKYNDYNVCVCCANCHRKIHSGRIVIHGKHFSTSGRYVIHYTEDGVEMYK